MRIKTLRDARYVMRAGAHGKGGVGDGGLGPVGELCRSLRASLVRPCLYGLQIMGYAPACLQ
jgi:hypothetical protein